MELATALDRKRSRLAQARLARQLPVREAAAKAGLTEDEVAWLEEGRVYRFRTPDDGAGADAEGQRTVSDRGQGRVARQGAQEG